MLDAVAAAKNRRIFGCVFQRGDGGVNGALRHGVESHLPALFMTIENELVKRFLFRLGFQ